MGPTYLDDNGNPVGRGTPTYLDDNGNPVAAAAAAPTPAPVSSALIPSHSPRAIPLIPSHASTLTRKPTANAYMQSQMDQGYANTGRFLGAMNSTMGGSDNTLGDLATGLKHEVQHPIDSAKLVLDSMGKSEQDLIDRAYTEQHTPGQRLSGVAHGALSVLPGGTASAQAGDALGQGDYATAAGITAGIAAPMLIDPAADAVAESGPGQAAGRLLDKVKYPMSKRMLTKPPQAAVNPTENFTPLQIKQYAEEQGIKTPSAAELTESGPLRALQSVGEKSTMGSGLIREHKEGVSSGIYQKTGQLMDSTSKSPNAEYSGKLIKAGTEAAEENSRTYGYEPKYDNFRQKYGNSVGDIDMRPVNNQFFTEAQKRKTVIDNSPKDEVSQSAAMLDKARRFGRRSVDFETGEEKIDPKMSLQEALDLRSNYWDKYRQFKSAGNRSDAALAKEISQALDGRIREHIQQSTGKQGVAAWDQANAAYKQHIETFKGDDSVLSEILQTGKTDMGKLPGKVAERGSVGGNMEHVKQMRAQGVDVGPLQREVIADIQQGNMGVRRNRLGGYSDEFLKELFKDKPQALDELYKTAHIARHTGVDSNPSNTGGIVSATGDVEAAGRAGVEMLRGNPGAATGIVATIPGVKWGAAKLSMNPAFNKWMTAVNPEDVGLGGKALRSSGFGPDGYMGPGGVDRGPVSGAGGESGESGGRPGGLTPGQGRGTMEAGGEQRGVQQPQPPKGASKLTKAGAGTPTPAPSVQEQIEAHRLTISEMSRVASDPKATAEEKAIAGQAVEHAKEQVRDLGQPEGARRAGTGPGAMLGKGARLLMRTGPETGPGMTVYHGTHADLAPAILRDGLRRPDETGVVGKNSAEAGVINTSRNKSVAKWYAETGADAEGSPTKQPGAVFHIELPKGIVDNNPESQPRDTNGVWDPRGVYNIPGEFRMTRSTENIPPQLIKKVEYVGPRARVVDPEIVAQARRLGVPPEQLAEEMRQHNARVEFDTLDRKDSLGDELSGLAKKWEKVGVSPDSMLEPSQDHHAIMALKERLGRMPTPEEYEASPERRGRDFYNPASSKLRRDTPATDKDYFGNKLSKLPPEIAAISPQAEAASRKLAPIAREAAKQKTARSGSVTDMNLTQKEYDALIDQHLTPDEASALRSYLNHTNPKGKPLMPRAEREFNDLSSGSKLRKKPN